MESKTTQDYLKVIYKLQHEMRVVSTNAIAASLGISAASVTDMMKKLSSRGYISYQPYQGATLSPAGKKIALKVLRTHRLIELFLYEVLKMPWESVHQEADIWEHFISNEAEKHIDKLLGHPTIDPHGAPIPGKNGKIKQTDQVRLSELSKGQKAVVTEVVDDDPELLKYLVDINLKPGMKFVVKSKSEYDKITTIKAGNHEISLGEKASENIYVRIC